MNDLNEFHETNLLVIYNEWNAIFLKIETCFEEVADHLKEFNGYYGAWYEFGLLHMPMNEPCEKEKKCKKCIEKENV